jgi:O-methyltransferase
MSLSHLIARAAVKLHPGLTFKRPVTGFSEDGLTTLHNADFLHEPRFRRAYDLGKATGSWYGCDLRWRIHVLLWAASHAAHLPGNFVECGVNRGGFARAIIDYIDFGSLNRSFHLFDTFEGFDLSQLSESERAMVKAHYHYDDCFADVSHTFRDMPFVKLERGSVPASLHGVGPIAFLSIDMNCAAPEIAAAEFFWPQMTSGAPIVLDDYGFALHHEQKVAFDAFATRHGVRVLSLPTGQGLILKP